MPAHRAVSLIFYPAFQGSAFRLHCRWQPAARALTIGRRLKIKTAPSRTAGKGSIPHLRPPGEPVEPTDNQQLSPSTGSGNDFIFRQTARSVSLSNRTDNQQLSPSTGSGNGSIFHPPPARSVSLSNRTEPITNNCPLRLAQGTNLHDTTRPLGEPVEPAFANSFNLSKFPAIKASFFFLVHPCICFSRQKASSILENSSA